MWTGGGSWGIAGNIPAALRDVERALKLQPGFPKAMLLRASLLGKAGRYDPALADLNTLLKAHPDNPEVLIQMAAVYQASRQFHKALSAYDQLLKSDPKNAAAYQGRATSYLGLGKPLEAIANYDAALKIEPQNSDLLNNRAWVLATSPDSNVRDGNRAVELAKLACARTAYLRAEFISTLAAAYAEAGDFQSAISWSQRAVEICAERLREQMMRQIETFQSRKPWREALPPVANPDRNAPPPERLRDPRAQNLDVTHLSRVARPLAVWHLDQQLPLSRR